MTDRMLELGHTPELLGESCGKEGQGGCYPVSLHLSKEDSPKVSGRGAEASRQAGHWVRVTVTQACAMPHPSLGVVDFSRVKQRLIF